MITKNLKVNVDRNKIFSIVETTIDENGKQTNEQKIISSGVIHDGQFLQSVGNLKTEVLEFLINEFYTAPKYPAHLFEKPSQKCSAGDKGCGEDPCICKLPSEDENEYIQQMADRFGGVV